VAAEGGRIHAGARFESAGADALAPWRERAVEAAAAIGAVIVTGAGTGAGADAAGAGAAAADAVRLRAGAGAWKGSGAVYGLGSARDPAGGTTMACFFSALVQGRASSCAGAAAWARTFFANESCRSFASGVRRALPARPARRRRGLGWAWGAGGATLGLPSLASLSAGAVTGYFAAGDVDALDAGLLSLHVERDAEREDQHRGDGDRPARALRPRALATARRDAARIAASTAGGGSSRASSR
jgi:hypothetical protein